MIDFCKFKINLKLEFICVGINWDSKLAEITSSLLRVASFFSCLPFWIKSRKLSPSIILSRQVKFQPRLTIRNARTLDSGN